jgi:peptide/nickel transport system substrate-binding protein
VSKVWIIVLAIVIVLIGFLVLKPGAPPAPQQPSQVQQPSAPPQPQVPTTPPQGQQPPAQPSPPPQPPAGVAQQTAPQAVETGGVKNPDTLIFADAGDVADTLDPAYAYDTSSGFFLFNIYENLIKFDGASTEQLAPLLATQVPSTDNGLITQNPDGSVTISFPLRSGVKFQNGDPLTPDDAAYSIQRLLLMDRSGGPSWLLLSPLLGVNALEDYALQLEAKATGKTPDAIRDAAKQAGKKPLEMVSPATLTQTCQDVQHAITVDGDKVVFHLPTPFPPFLAILAHGATWASIIDKPWATAQGAWDGRCDNWLKYHDPDKAQDPLYGKTNGTGPFALEKWDLTTNQIWLIRNDNYWRGPAKLKRVIDENAGEWPTRQLMLKNGDADMTGVPRQFVDQIDGTPSIRLVKGQIVFALGYMFFNQAVQAEGNPYIGSGKRDGQGIPADFFADLDVRKGFEYSFDWKTYITQALKGEAEQPTGPIPRGVPYYNPENPVYQLDLAQAKAHFQQAFNGKLWDVGFKLNAVCVTPCEGADKTAFDILRRNLQQVNPKFQLEVTPVPWSTFLSQSVQGTPPLYLSGWQEDYHDAHDWVWPVMSSQGTYSEYLGIGTKYDQLIQQGISTLDPTKRQGIYDQLQKLAYDDALAIFLDQALGRHYERNWVGGYYYNPLHPLDLYPLYKAVDAQPDRKLIGEQHLTVLQW